MIERQKILLQYLSGIINESQYKVKLNESSNNNDDNNDNYRLTGVEDNEQNRKRFERLLKEKEVYLEFLRDVDTFGKYELIRPFIDESIIKTIKQITIKNSNLISRMQAVKL